MKALFEKANKDLLEKTKAQENLNEKMKELELFHNAAVDREFRMIELEKELERLKKEG